jgi:hypothetical protein
MYSTIIPYSRTRLRPRHDSGARSRCPRTVQYMVARCTKYCITKVLVVSKSSTIVVPLDSSVTYYIPDVHIDTANPLIRYVVGRAANGEGRALRAAGLGLGLGSGSGRRALRPRRVRAGRDGPGRGQLRWNRPEGVYWGGEDYFIGM